MNHYEVLGVTRSATNAEIEAAFCDAVDRHASHDNDMASIANARRIQKAYETLVDPGSRKQYERDTFRKRTWKPYLLPGQKPPLSHLGRLAMIVFVLIPTIWASYHLACWIWDALMRLSETQRLI